MPQSPRTTDSDGNDPVGSDSAGKESSKTDAPDSAGVKSQEPNSSIPNLGDLHESVSDGELATIDSDPSPLNEDQDHDDSAVDSDEHVDPAVSEFHKQKLKERREEWRINSRVATISAVAFASLLILATASYFYNSSAAAQTFRMRAEEAAAAGEKMEESRWWSRYLMMFPDDPDVIIKAAYAADEAADLAEEEERARAITNARNRLSNSLARIPATRAQEQQDIRRRLIRRLLQSGGFWLREAERQVVDNLNADQEDAFAHKALALAIYGQIDSDLYKEKTGPGLTPPDNYWSWLDQQNALIIMRRAVQVAPNDVDCIAAFLRTLQMHPEFAADNDQAAAKVRDLPAQAQQWHGLITDRQTLIDQSLENLRQIGSGRSHLIAYYHNLQGENADPQSAQLDLFQSADGIALGLQEDLAKQDATEEQNADLSIESEQTATGEAESEQTAELVLLRRMTPAYWDYQLLLEAARLAAAKAAGQPTLPDESVDQVSDEERAKYATLAEHWYSTLINASVPDVTAKMRENTFLYAGLHQQLAGAPNRAVEIWRQGLEDVSIDNLELNGAIANQLVRTATTDEELDEAEKAIDAFGKAIEAERGRLLVSTTIELTQAQRTYASRVLEMATWRFNVAGAELRTRRDGGTKLTSEAIAKLRDALRSRAEVRPIEKALLAQNLAALYAQHEVWDQAADALTIASDLMPSNIALHVLAGEAWTRAGNRSRAARHWRSAGASASLDIRIKAAQAEFNFQLRSPPALRDFSSLRLTVEQLEREFDAMLADGANQPFNQEERDQLETSLRILKMSLPPLGILAEQHLASRQLAVFADDLASEKIDNASIQAYAAERLAAVGMDEKATVRLARLEEIQGKDSTSVAIVAARIDASKGKPANAANRLLRQIEINPEMADQLARSASNYFLAARDLAQSYQALQQIPDDRRLPNDLYLMYRQAKQLAQASDDPSAADQFNQQATKWSTELRSIEEPEETIAGVTTESVGTYWRMIAVEEKLNELRSESEDLARKDPRVIEVQDLLETITTQRPRWGHALSMRGYLSAIMGKHDEAVEQLREGIDAGDRSLRTRQVLLEELITLNRDAEAEEEMKRMAMSVDFVVDPYAKQDIRSAFNRGELAAAVDAARQTVENNPEDANAKIVFARVASTAVQLDEQQAAAGKDKTQLTEQQRSDLVEQARTAIREAKALATENQLALAAATLDLEFRHGTPETVKAEFDVIQKSDLPEHERLLLLARVKTSEGDIDGAITALRESNKILPTAATQVQLANLFQVRGQSVDVVAALRDAVKLQPGNQKLRTELAKAIVVHEGEDADWSEIESLLQTGNGATASDQLVYAMLLGARDDGEQLVKALGIARTLAQEQNTISYEASVLQVRILAKLIDHLEGSVESGSTERRERYLQEARTVSRSLASARSATAADLYRHAAFLLKYGSDEDLAKVKSLSDQLAVMPNGLAYAMQLGLIFNQRSGSDVDASGVVEGLAEQAKSDLDERMLGDFESVAGGFLLQNGFVDEGLDWFKKSYEANEAALSSYIMALAKAQQFEKAAEVAAAHYNKHEDVVSATLLVEALLASDSPNAATKYAATLQAASKRHSRNAGLLESFATWAMQNGKPEEAIKFYQQVIAVDPLRLRTLNNIAMAYTQVPGMAGEGIVYIDRAIKLTKRSPETLDTMGVVLMKARRNQEALKIFDEAIQALGAQDPPQVEPRFIFHKILVLLALNQQQQARQLWDALDVNEIDTKGLTQEEQQILEKMKTDFNAYITEQS